MGEKKREIERKKLRRREKKKDGEGETVSKSGQK